MWLYFLGPIGLTIAAAIVAARSFRAQTEMSPGSIALAVLGLQFLATVLTIAVVVILVSTPVASRCQSGVSLLDTVVVLSGWVVAIIGGIALGAMRADASRQGGTLVWHLPAGVVVFLLPYVVFVAVFYLALTCTS